MFYHRTFIKASEPLSLQANSDGAIILHIDQSHQFNFKFKKALWVLRV